MEKNNGNGQLFTAFLAGAVVGATVAVLFAPKSGEVTRRNIKRGAYRISDNLVSTAQAVSGNAQKNLEESGDNLGYQIGSAIARTVLSVEEIAGILKAKLQELRSGDETFIVNSPSLRLSERNSIGKVTKIS